MKRKVARVVLVVAVLGALAAIPASTQGFLRAVTSSSDATGADLEVVLLVNRLELSRQQMETLHSTIDGLAEKSAVLDEKRDAFEREMIAFSGTSAELDTRLTAFQKEMTATRAALVEDTRAAAAALKDTLTMKQGEILAAARPGLLGRLDVPSSTDSTGAAPQAGADGLRAMAGNGRIVFRGGRHVMVVTPSTTVADTARGTGVVERLRTVAERIRERVADRLAGTPAGAPSAEMVGDTGDLGSATLSFFDGHSLAGARGTEWLVNWLERFAEVLELKLAAMT